ncbi:MAG: peptidylprolyl isomerase [Sphingobacteriales bacterium]|nr:peptidylprolyl isomerase [Sphingobacteriales bacterium]
MKNIFSFFGITLLIIFSFSCKTEDNLKPTATADKATADEGTEIVLDLLANDKDPEQAIDSNSVKILKNIALLRGKVTIKKGTLSFLPERNFSGDETFEYMVCDNHKQCDTATVLLHIEPVHVALISTELGDMKVKLYNQTPRHRDNFIKLTKEGFYDGTLFHRVMMNFMIQGGDPDSKLATPNQKLGNGGPGYNIPAEFVPDLIHKRGALAAARMGDAVNPKKESNGSQFYLVQGQKFSPVELAQVEKVTKRKLAKSSVDIYTTLGGAPFLDGDYTVFGEVIEGLDVIDRIAMVGSNPQSRPFKDIPMTVKMLK